MPLRRTPHGIRIGMRIVRVMPAFVAVGALCGILAACGSSKAAETRATPSVLDSPVRGTEEAADSVPELTRTAVYRSLLRNFFRPVAGQARWIDPQPLGEKRGTADSTINAVADDELPPDAGWAASIVEAAGMERVCMLGGDETGCTGRKGGVLRLSPVYSAGRDRVHVYVRYTPHGGAAGPVTEQRFTLTKRGDYWRIDDNATVSTPKGP